MVCVGGRVGTRDDWNIPCALLMFVDGENYFGAAVHYKAFVASEQC